MSEWKYGEMPRAFLVKNKLRRSTGVDNSQTNMSPTDLDDWTSGEQPSQLQNCTRNRCSVAEKNGSTSELTHRTHDDVTRRDLVAG